MIVIAPPDHARHDPDSVVGAAAGGRPYWERAARADALLAAVRDVGLDVRAPRDAGIAPAAAVHDAGYLRFLTDAFAQWRAVPANAADRAVVPRSFAVRQTASHRPASIIGLAGWHLSGGGSPVLEGTWQAALAASHAAADAAALILDGGREAYALARPPGHHATTDLAGGFCYLNNAAIATERLIRGGAGRVAILDIDVHHGNGTQAIFYDRGDVNFISVHADPATLYPFYAGYAEETGQGRGAGHNRNLPLPPGSSDTAWLAAIEAGISGLRADALVVSLGFDALEGDPTANLAVTIDGYARAARLIGALGLPTVLVQEGGYRIDRLRPALTAFLDAFLQTRRNAAEAS